MRKERNRTRKEARERLCQGRKSASTKQDEGYKDSRTADSTCPSKGARRKGEPGKTLPASASQAPGPAPGIQSVIAEGKLLEQGPALPEGHMPQTGSSQKLQWSDPDYERLGIRFETLTPKPPNSQSFRPESGEKE